MDLNHTVLPTTPLLRGARNLNSQRSVWEAVFTLLSVCGLAIIVSAICFGTDPTAATHSLHSLSENEFAQDIAFRNAYHSSPSSFLSSALSLPGRVRVASTVSPFHRAIRKSPASRRLQQQQHNLRGGQIATSAVIGQTFGWKDNLNVVE